MRETNRGYGLTPKGEAMPQTIEEWRHLVDLDEKVMLRDKETISYLKQRLNKVEQRLLSTDTVRMGLVLENDRLERKIRELRGCYDIQRSSR